MTANLSLKGVREVEDMLIDLAVSLDNQVAQVAKAIASQVLIELVNATPVKSGNARANWQVTLNAPAGAAVPASSNPMEGLRAIAGVTGGETIYIQNRVPYIWRLNEGYSPQAGAGWIERAIDLGVYAGQRVRIIGG